MEELQSTELLDREIREDAQKKAYRILKSADEAVQARDMVWEQKICTGLAGIRQKYAQGFETIQRELQARLVLDKRRIRAEKIEGLLASAMDAYFRSLPRKSLLSLLARELHRCVGEIQRTGEPASGFTVQCRGLTDAEGMQVLKTCLPPGTWTFSSAHSRLILEESFPEIVVDASTVQITISIRELGKTLLEDKRAELVEALMGPDVLVNEASL
jgi:V/A-type H+-transporting ATPase subunit E